MYLFITFILIKMENDVKFLILENKKPLPTNGLKINRSLHTKKKKAKERRRNGNDSFEVSSTCCDRNNKLIGTITDSL